MPTGSSYLLNSTAFPDNTPIIYIATPIGLFVIDTPNFFTPNYIEQKPTKTRPRENATIEF